MSDPVAKVSALAPGSMTPVSVNGTPVLLCNCDGEIYAVEDVCTHDGGVLHGGELEDCRLMCPRHGAYFDVKTGKALTLPAIFPLPVYAVRIDGDDVYVDPPTPR
jgi:3-phenylpropionate/trans-cinnamate dioxygenase ferredoxin subunit